MKKSFLLLALLFLATFSFAQNIEQKQIYNGGVYGQTLQMFKYDDGNRVKLELFLMDNLTKQTKTYDPSIQTVYSIRSEWFTSASKYSKVESECEGFLDHTLNYVYLADLKDICDIAPCCKSTDYGVRKTNDGKQKFIYIEYECSDLPLLFEIANAYNSKSREYVLEHYAK